MPCSLRTVCVEFSSNAQARLAGHLRLRDFHVLHMRHSASLQKRSSYVNLFLKSQRALAADLLRCSSVLYVVFVLPDLCDECGIVLEWVCNQCVELSKRRVSWTLVDRADGAFWSRVYGLLQSSGVDFHTTSFQIRSTGSKTPSNVALWSSGPELSQLRPVYDCGAWRPACGILYLPPTVCQHWSFIIEDLARARGCVLSAASIAQLRDWSNRAALGDQPRGGRVPPLLTDFLAPRKYRLSQCPTLKGILPGGRVPDHLPFPKGSRVLRVSPTDADGGSFVMLGLPRDPLDYIQEASQLVHPMERSGHVAEGVQAAIDKHAQESAEALRRDRASFFSGALQSIRNLRVDEDRLHSNMPEHLARVMQGKRVLFLGELLEKIQHPDKSLIQHLSQGFPLLGWLEPSGVFAPSLKPPALRSDELERMAPEMNESTCSSCVQSRRPDVDRALWESTLEEVAKGWADGPYDLDGAKQTSGGKLVVSRRFAVVQKDKIRAIDDFSASHINLCTGLREKVRVESVDAAAAMIRQWMLALKGTGRRLVGKSFDLKSAYRQIGVCKEHLFASWVCIYNPETGAPALFRLHALPFGASASVPDFLRCAEAIKCAGARCIFLSWTSFFDDFICVCPEDCAEETDKATRVFFELLGWQLALEPKKNKPFASKFQALGVEFDLTNAADGVLRISNTESRKEELGRAIDDVLSSGRLSFKTATSLRSRMLFAESQIFGRFAKKAINLLGKHADNAHNVLDVDRELRAALEWLRNRVVYGSPREVSVAKRKTFLLFLDGACDNESPSLQSSVGGVLIDKEAGPQSSFGEIVPNEAVSAWKTKVPKGAKQLNFEAEVMPYVVALKCWADVLRGALLLIFIDNDAARHAWVSASAHSLHASNMIHHALAVEADLGVDAYFCRVPTHSNIADAPSRLDFSVCESIGATRMRVSERHLLSCAGMTSDVVGGLCVCPQH